MARPKSPSRDPNAWTPTPENEKYPPVMSAVQLQLIREKLGITQTEMAKRTGYSVASISLYESGQRRVPWRLAKQLKDIKP